MKHKHDFLAIPYEDESPGKLKSSTVQCDFIPAGISRYINHQQMRKKKKKKKKNAVLNKRAIRSCIAPLRTQFNKGFWGIW